MFRFKQFTIEQDACAMKVGTDGVLLGAWVPLCGSEHRVLDIGTGTGVIAIMLAQRLKSSEITAIDIVYECVEQARLNADNSPWGDRIKTVCSSVQQFEGDGEYDLIISNPPFFENSLKSPDSARSVARHTDTLSYTELIDAVLRLLSKGGKFAIVLPYDEARRFLMLSVRGLSLLRRVDVKTTPKRAPKRTLMLFSRSNDSCEVECEELVIQTAPEQFTEQYRLLTRDFYLKF